MTSTFDSVNVAFSKQSVHYDTDDSQNTILKEWRQQVYDHVYEFLKPGQRLLELNAGTGLDALYFVQSDNTVLATDLSDGMIREIEKKIQLHSLTSKLSCQQVSYDRLETITDQKFDYVFSNFGGLNCIDDLSKVTKHLPALLNDGAYVTWVIMPRISLWEMAGALKGNGKHALRRFQKNGVMAHLEGEYFSTFYHSLSDIKKSFDSSFLFIRSEGLGVLSPPPHRDDLTKKRTGLYSLLRNIDAIVRNLFPFNHTGDHLIVTFQYHK